MPRHDSADVRIRVFLVDHNRSYRASLRTELLQLFAVAGEAGDAQTAAERILSCQPDVVLLDVHVPGGPAVVETVHMRQHKIRFMGMSISDTSDDIIRVIRSGALGTVSKATPAAELANAIRQVYSGDVVIPSHLAGLVLEAFLSRVTEPSNHQPQRLTSGERYVLRQLGRGFTRDEIADDLSVPTAAVAAQLSAILDRLRLPLQHGGPDPG